MPGLYCSIHNASAVALDPVVLAVMPGKDSVLILGYPMLETTRFKYSRQINGICSTLG